MRASALLLVALAACAPGKSTLTVTVTSINPVSGIDHLRVFVTDQAGRKSHEADVPVLGKTVPPAIGFALRLPSSVNGSVVVAVDAMAAGAATPIASASGSVTIKPSTTATLTLTLPAPALPARLVFSVQPSDSAIGAAIKPPVQVAIADASGATVAGASGSISIALGANPSNATLGGTLTAAAQNGVATFADLTLDADGAGYTLVASAGALPPSTSNPFNVRAAVWQQATNGIFGGDVRALASGGTPAVLYAGTLDSGVFRSSNDGGTWVGLQNGFPMAMSGYTLATVNALTVDPKDGNRVFVATDAGVWLTTNGGASWTLAYDKSASFSAVALDAGNLMVAYAANFGKVYKTVDGGTTWNDDSAGLVMTGGIRSLFAYSGGVALTGYNNITGNGGGVWRQTTGNWVRDAGWPSTGFAGSYAQQIACDGNGSTCVCATDSGIFRSTNSGGAWTQLMANPNNIYGTGGTAVAWRAGSANDAFVGIVGNANSNGVWLSTDAGNSWNGYTNALSTQVVRSIAADAGAGASVYAATGLGVYKLANGGAAFSSAGLTAMPIVALVANGATVFAGTTAAVYKSSDRGLNWGLSSGSGANAITAGRISALAMDPASATTLYAGQPDTGVWKSSDGGANWKNVGTSAAGLGDLAVLTLAVAPSNPMLLYAGTAGGLYKSTDGGVTWASGNLSGAAVTAIVFDPAAAATLYAAAGTNVYKTTNGGTLWTVMNGTLPSTSAMNALVLDAAGTLYAGNAAGALFKSGDGAATWTATGDLKSPLSAIVAHPSKAGVIYAVGAGGVARATDGSTFAAFNVGFDYANVMSLAFDRADPTLLYAGTVGGGVYKAAP